MTEQFLEIAKQSGLKFQSETALSPPEEKFAQLIVQSCISEVAMMGVTNYENKDITWAVDVIIKNIKSRWGVES